MLLSIMMSSIEESKIIYLAIMKVQWPSKFYPELLWTYLDRSKYPLKRLIKMILQ